MWNDQQQRYTGALPPPHPGQRMTKSAPCSPVKPLVKRPPTRADSFHVIHKVPLGDSPYVKAKHVQLVDKEPDRAIALFWAAINAGDRVDSALKDMAIVMKQQNRPEEAIEAIKSLRNRCSDQAQESLDNVLLDLYKRCGRLEDQIDLLKHKLQLIYAGLAFNGKRTKTARSQGKKFQVSIEQEATRLLGNLGWAYMQQSNYIAAEGVYRKALSMEPDNNKVCNLGICLMKQGRLEEAKLMLQSVMPACADARWGADSHLKSYERAQEMLREMETTTSSCSSSSSAAGMVGRGDSELKGILTQDLVGPRRSLEQQLNLRDPMKNFSGQTAPSSASSYTQFSGMLLKQQIQQQLPPFVVSYDSWDDEEFDELDDTMADENNNVNIIVQSQQQSQQHFAEALKKKLDMLCSSNNNSSNININNISSGIITSKSSNNSSNPSPNFSPSKPPRFGSRPSSARRSLSLESFDNLSVQPGLPPVHQTTKASGIGRTLPSVKQPFQEVKQPFQEQQQQLHVLPPAVPSLSSSSWGELGFIQSPKALDFASENAAESTARCQQQQQQQSASSRRLRVFQDITTATSPLAR